MNSTQGQIRTEGQGRSSVQRLCIHAEPLLPRTAKEKVPLAEIRRLLLWAEKANVQRQQSPGWISALPWPWLFVVRHFCAVQGAKCFTTCGSPVSGPLALKRLQCVTLYHPTQTKSLNDRTCSCAQVNVASFWYSPRHSSLTLGLVLVFSSGSLRASPAQGHVLRRAFHSPSLLYPAAGFPIH